MRLFTVNIFISNLNKIYCPAKDSRKKKICSLIQTGQSIIFCYFCSLALKTRHSYICSSTEKCSYENGWIWKLPNSQRKKVNEYKNEIHSFQTWLVSSQKTDTRGTFASNQSPAQLQHQMWLILKLKVSPCGHAALGRPHLVLDSRRTIFRAVVKTPFLLKLWMFTANTRDKHWFRSSPRVGVDSDSWYLTLSASPSSQTL